MDCYRIMKLFSFFSKNRREFMIKYLRKKGVLIGNNCNICCNITSAEKYLIEIGDNVTVSEDVLFLTHDASVGKIFGKENGSDLFGRIVIGNNCFIGARSIILYGVTIPNNSIVAAGSVVTKSWEKEGVIFGGNPAREISTTDRLKQKSESCVFQVHGIKGKKLQKVVENNQQKFIKR